MRLAVILLLVYIIAQGYDIRERTMHIENDLEWYLEVHKEQVKS